ncbi:MAG: energy transducer TonB [Cyclobacteriaceae bacterium]
MILVLSIQACGPSQAKKEVKAAPEPKPEKEVVISASERHARVGMKRTKMTEERRVAFARLVEVTPFYTDADGVLIYNKAETVPHYNGGEDAMNLFLEENTRYPKGAMEEKLEGTVFVDFLVDANGNIRRASVANSTFTGDDKLFREEAIRVVNSMPKWKAGRQGGNTVNVQFSLPVTFLLD